MSAANNLPSILQDRFVEIDDYDPERQLVGKLRLSLLLIGGLLVVGFVGGALVPIGGAVIGSGQIGVETHVKKISHPAGGTVTQILVENGQHVRKGQILIRLDDKVSGTEAQLSSLSVDQMLALKARLEAEQMGAGAVTFPDALTKRSDPAAQRAMADEARMFAIKRAEEAGLNAQHDSRIAQYRQQIVGYEAQITALRRQAGLIQTELEGIRRLYEKQLVPLARLNQLERAAADMEGSIGAMTASIAEANSKISETREQMIQSAQTRRSSAGDQLSQLNSQLNQVQVHSVSATDVQERTVIRAPYSGVVEKLAVSTIGGVIRPADVIMEIVPDQDRLLVEGAINPGEIDRVHVDQPARARFTALNRAATPAVEGRVVYVGAEQVTTPDGTRSYFPVRVAMDPASLAHETSTKLKAGMPADIYIATGSRSLLSYLTKPIRDQFARAFRD